MSRALSRTVKRAVAGSAVALSLVAGLLAAPAAARPAAPTADIPAAPDCPATMPVADLTAGMTGQGLTVVRGSTPQPFAVEVLGVLEDGIGGGKDLIIVEASDLPGRNVISAGGGIWSGMSGSPVYVDGKLIGAVGYSFSNAPSPIGGITPAADMLDLLDLARPAARKAGGKSQPKPVSLSAAERTAIAARATAAVPRGSLEALPSPVALSGLSPKRIRQFQSEADAGGMSVVAYAGSRAGAPTSAALRRPAAGSNFGAVLAYGDLTAAAFGTTTVVCGDQALAFGHPFQYVGPATYGANDGTSLTIVKDATAGPYKLASIGAPLGTVDQDRLAGIRADLAKAPALTPVLSTVRNLDRGRQRAGSTLAADRGQLPAITAYGLLSAHDAIFDEAGDGQAATRWEITGTRAGNRPFTLVRGNRIASRSEVAPEVSFDPAYAVEALLDQDLEPVTISKVRLWSNITTRYSHYTISKLEVSVDGGAFSQPKVLRVKGGATLRLRVTLRPFQSSTLVTTTLTTTVPRAKGRVGTLQVSGGADLAQAPDEEGCLIGKESCEEDAEPTFDALLKDIAKEWRNDDVVSRLVLEPGSETQKPIRKETRKRQTKVVFGDKTLAIEIR